MDGWEKGEGVSKLREAAKRVLDAYYAIEPMTECSSKVRAAIARAEGKQ